MVYAAIKPECIAGRERGDAALAPLAQAFAADLLGQGAGARITAIVGPEVGFLRRRLRRG